MCEKCDRVTALVNEVNAGTRSFDREVLEAILLQAEHSFDEMLTDVRTSETPLHEVLQDCADTMANLAVVFAHNSRHVYRAAGIERERLVKKAAEMERVAKDRQELFEHLVAQHGRSTATDASLEVLRHDHAIEHQRSTVPTTTPDHINTGR